MQMKPDIEQRLDDLITGHQEHWDFSDVRNYFEKDDMTMVVIQLKLAKHVQNFTLPKADLGMEVLRILTNILSYNGIGIQRLNIESASLVDAGAELIANMLKTNTLLKGLNIACNEISDKGAKDIAEALKINKTLKYLNLEVNGIGDLGARKISMALCSNTALEGINLRYNNIGDSGAICFAFALIFNNTLKKLDLSENADSGADSSYCGIGNDGVSSITKALKRNDCIEELKLTLDESELTETEVPVDIDNGIAKEFKRVYAVHQFRLFLRQGSSTLQHLQHFSMRNNEKQTGKKSNKRGRSPSDDSDDEHEQREMADNDDGTEKKKPKL